MFLNYFSHPTRDSALNIAVARMLLALLAIWKLLSDSMESLPEWPAFLYQQHIHGTLLWFPEHVHYLFVEKWVALFLLVCFFVGWRIPLVSFLSALLLAHLSAIHYVVTNSGATWLPVIYVLIFFALYPETDEISVDGMRRAWRRSLAELKEYLVSGTSPARSMVILKWTLLVVGLIYYFNGYSKLAKAGIAWIAPEHLGIIIHQEALMLLNEIPLAGEWMLGSYWLLVVSTWATIILECGFVIVILFRRSITLFIIGLAGLHAMIFVSMNILFFDQYLIFLLFLPWDRLFARAESNEPVVVVYDTECYFCVRSLYIFKALDLNGSVAFRSPDEVAYDETTAQADFNEAMFLFRGDASYRGYYAFAELLAHYRIFFPFAWIMRRTPVAKVGERIYSFVAARRKEVFACKIDSNNGL